MNKVIAYKTILINTSTNCTFIASKLDEQIQTGSRNNDSHIEWAGELDISIINNLKYLLYELYEDIKHGDEEHQLWLKNKIDDFIKIKS
jgi:hypothetical protein